MLAKRFPLIRGMAALFLLSCASLPTARPASVQIDEAAQAFFTALAEKGTAAQSYFTAFLPQDAVNVRHRIRFFEETEKALRKAASAASMHYNASADRVFLLSRHEAEGWESPDPKGGEVLSSAFSTGSEAGWTALHAFWGQYNRLLIGDDAWIQNLPDSVRADLSHPLAYVVRISVSLESNPTVTTFVHRLTLELIEVGKERCLFNAHYPLVLTYPLP